MRDFCRFFLTRMPKIPKVTLKGKFRGMMNIVKEGEKQERRRQKLQDAAARNKAEMEAWKWSRDTKKHEDKIQRGLVKRRQRKENKLQCVEDRKKIWELKKTLHVGT